MRLPVLLSLLASLPAADYHVSNAGSDAADGLTPATAWQSFAKLPATLAAGDRVLLRAGDTWRDSTLTVSGTGSAERPIVIGSYGDGDRPLLIWDQPSGEHADGSTGISVNTGGWLTVRGLEVRRAVVGLRLKAPADGSRWQGLRVEDCFFHDNIVPAMRGDPDVGDDHPTPGWKEGQPPPKKVIRSGTAIAIEGPPQSFLKKAPETLPLIRGLVIANNYGFENGHFLQAGVGHDYSNPMGTGLEVVGNTVAFGDKNQMQLTGWHGSRVHRNVMVYNGSRRYFGFGLTCIMALRERDCVYEDNELGWHGETESSRGPAKDGCGFDWEGPSSGSIFRRNFVHDCLAEALLTMADKPDNPPYGRLTIAENLLAYNARYSIKHRQELTLGSISADFQVLGNTFFLRPGIAKTKTNKGGQITEQGSTVHQGALTHRDPRFAPQPRVSALTAQPGLRRLRFAAIPGAELRYTTDGSLPMPDSPLLPESVEFRRSGALNVTAFMAGRQRSPVSSHLIDLRDRSGSAPLHHLTAPGAPAADLKYPAWLLDGTAPQLDAPALATPINEFSISCWVKPDAALRHDPATPMDWRSFATLKFKPKAPPPFAVAAVNAAAQGADHAGLGIAVGANGVGVYEHGKDHLACLVVDHLTPITGWTHVVVTVRDRTPRLWIDGEFRRVGSTTRRSLHPSLRLADGFRGGIADLRVYDRVLSVAEIQELATP